MNHLLEKIKQYNKIVIFGHIRPDGDCYGSQFGLKDIILETFKNKEVYVVGGKCEYVSFLGIMDVIEDEVIRGSLGIVVDTSDHLRVSDERYNLCDYVIKVDHHINIDQYADYEIVDENACACAQIVTEFYYSFKEELKISPFGATSLYVGILTDSGRFKYDSISSKTFFYAGVLVDLGIKISEIDNLLSVETLNTIKLKGYVLLNFKTTESGFAYMQMTRDIINQFQVSDEEAAGLVNMLSSIDGFPVWAFFVEYPNEIRIRLRSRGPEVDKLANMYNGGGHKMASGARLESWGDLDKFINDCNNLVKEYKENI